MPASDQPPRRPSRKPPQPGSTSTFAHTTTCRFDRDLFARIRLEAERRGVSNGEVIRVLVAEGLARRDGFEQAARETFGADLAAHGDRLDRLEGIVRELVADVRWRHFKAPDSGR